MSVAPSMVSYLRIDHPDLTGKSTLLDVLEDQGPDRRRTPAPADDGDAPWRKDPFEAKVDITPPEGERSEDIAATQSAPSPA